MGQSDESVPEVAGDPLPESSVNGTPFVSLYRRFRPGRFEDLRGQPHVVLGLRSAVRDDHVAHAYLFSGPRGTGKTSTARILARALNCANPKDGEPCGVCTSCVEIARGTSLDVTELDAASNNGVEAMRDLVSHAALGTPGRWKVYIVDEVHMLSNAAANALLKTLEEPPAHVVFVLATTDPQKVPATIRSRTQHFEFRLIGSDTLQELLEDVRTQAGLPLDNEDLAVAVRRGRGSARDALSALDQVAASGSADDPRPALDEAISALCELDAHRLLVVVASLHDAGWGSSQLASELVDELRQAFLVALAPELADRVGAERDRLARQAEQLGLARMVRTMELLGRAQVDMRDAPDPRVVLEVALVRSARPELDDSLAAVVERLDRIERGSVQPPPMSVVPPRPVETATASDGRSLGAIRRARQGSAGTAGAPGSAEQGPAELPDSSPPSVMARGEEPVPPPDQGTAAAGGPTLTPPPPPPAPAPAPPQDGPDDVPDHVPAPPAPAPVPAGPAGAPGSPSAAEIPPSTDVAPPGVAVPTRDALVEAWGDHILRGLPAKAKALFSAGRFLAVEQGTAVFGLPNAVHRDKCEEVRGVVETAIAAHFGIVVPVDLVVDGPPNVGASSATGRGTGSTRSAGASSSGGAGERRPKGARGTEAGAGAGDEFSLSEGDDFDPDDPGTELAVESVAEARLLEAFPGAQPVTE